MISHGCLATHFENDMIHSVWAASRQFAILSTFVYLRVYMHLQHSTSVYSIWLSNYSTLPVSFHKTAGRSNLSTSSTRVQWSPPSNLHQSIIFSAYTFHVRLAMVRLCANQPRSDWPHSVWEDDFVSTDFSNSFLDWDLQAHHKVWSWKGQLLQIPEAKNLKPFNVCSSQITKLLIFTCWIKVKLLPSRLQMDTSMIHRYLPIYLSISIESNFKQLILMLGPMMANGQGWWSGARGSQQPQQPLWRTCLLGQAEQLRVTYVAEKVRKSTAVGLGSLGNLWFTQNECLTFLPQSPAFRWVGLCRCNSWEFARVLSDKSCYPLFLLSLPNSHRKHVSYSLFLHEIITKRVIPCKKRRYIEIAVLQTIATS